MITNRSERRIVMALLILIVAVLAVLIMAHTSNAQTQPPVISATITPAAPCAPNTANWRRCQYMRSQRPLQRRWRR